MPFLVLLAALAVAWVVRYVLARRARQAFCGDGCLTLAIRVPGPSRGGKRWQHGFARLSPDLIEWRREYSLRDGADYTIRRSNLLVREHRPVVRGEAALSDRCELVSARYMDEDIQLAVVRTDLERFLAWAES